MRVVDNGRAMGIAAATGAVACGLAYMALAGAPLRLLLMNLAALAIGVVLLAISRLLAPALGRLSGALLILLSLVLVATTLSGMTVEGATRWVRVGGLSVQPSLILVPVLVTAHALRSDRWSAAAMAIAVLAIAAQPDRSVSAMLLAGAVSVALLRPTRTGLALTLLAAGGLASALLQPDRLPAMPYVDQILYTAVAAHPLAGLTVWLGTALLFIPAVSLLRDGQPVVALAFTTLWGGAVLSAALGNYPTPLVGYGGSAILGYLLCLLPLSTKENTKVPAGTSRPEHAEAKDERELRFA